MYIYASLIFQAESFQLKLERHNAIRELIAASPIHNQDELRRKLRRRGFAVTQATLSRDMHELHVLKGPGGYVRANGNGTVATMEGESDEGPPSVAEVMESFGVRCRQAMNQVVIATMMGGAQPVAAALDNENWPEVIGTIAGDDTVLVICADAKQAAETEQRLRRILGS